MIKFEVDGLLKFFKGTHEYPIELVNDNDGEITVRASDGLAEIWTIKATELAIELGTLTYTPPPNEYSKLKLIKKLLKD